MSFNMNLFAQRVGYTLAWLIIGGLGCLVFWLVFPFVVLVAAPIAFKKGWPRTILAEKVYSTNSLFPPCKNIFLPN